MIEDKREDISSLGLKYINKLYQIEDSTVLIQFGNQILPRVYHILLKYKGLVGLSADLLVTMKRYSSEIEIDLPTVVDLVANLSKIETSNLKIVVELFYITAFEPYCLNEDKRKAKG